MAYGHFENLAMEEAQQSALTPPMTSHGSSRPRTGEQERNYHEDLLRYIDLQRRRHTLLKKPTFPATHPRACCPFHPFTAEHGFEKFCSSCECFVCEVPAHQCPHWVSLDHCRANYRERAWQLARDRAHHGLPPVRRRLPPESLLPRRKIHNVTVKNAKKLASQSEEARREQYMRVTKAIGERKLAQLEASLREKLFNRVAAGPFQLRRNFKYFDKNSDGTIDVDEFAECLEYLMGVILPEDHVVALFARYDEDGSGTMEYPEFIQKLMGEYRDPSHIELEQFSSSMGNLSITYWRATSPSSGSRPRTSPVSFRGAATGGSIMGAGSSTASLGSGSLFDEDGDMDVISHRPRKIEPLPRYDMPPPHHPLQGSEEDSLNSCGLSLVPKKKVPKLPSREPQVRVFRARFARAPREDACRVFEITLFLDDGTMSIFEPPRKNSGVQGGKFLLRRKYKTRDGNIYTPDMFTQGAVLSIAGHSFEITQ